MPLPQSCCSQCGLSKGNCGCGAAPAARPQSAAPPACARCAALRDELAGARRPRKGGRGGGAREAQIAEAREGRRAAEAEAAAANKRGGGGGARGKGGGGGGGGREGAPRPRGHVRSLSQREAAEGAARARDAGGGGARRGGGAREERGRGESAQGRDRRAAEAAARGGGGVVGGGGGAPRRHRGGGGGGREGEPPARALRATEVEREAYKQQLEVAARRGPAAALREALEAAKARLAEATAEVAKLKAAGPNGASPSDTTMLEDNRKLQV